MESNQKKHSVFGILGRIITLGGSLYVGARLLKTHLGKSEKNHPLSEGEKNYYLNFSGKRIQMNSKDIVEKVQINANFSAIDLNLVQMKITEDIRIECSLFMSAVSIRVPENVEVVLDNQMKVGAVSNAVPSYYKEENPTICLLIHGSVSAVSIQCKASEEGN